MVLTVQHTLFSSFLLLLVSWNSFTQRLPEEPLRFHKDYTENGLIFGTITFPDVKMRFDNYSLYLNYSTDDKKIHRKNSSSIKIDPTMFVGKHYGELEGGKSYLFVIEKAPGHYDISSVKLTLFKLFDASPTFTAVTGFSIPFDVTKGEITYIGEINVNEYALKDENVISLKDQFDRDKTALKSLYKMVNWDLAVKSNLQLFHPTAEEKISNY
jgi:hypothetical protein